MPGRRPEPSAGHPFGTFGLGEAVKAIIVDSATSDIDDREGLRSELLNWARTLGVDTIRATPRFAIAWTAEGIAAYFSMKLQRDGHDYVLPNANRVAVDFGSVVILVENDSWPSWFGEAVEIPDMPIPVLLETLAVADEAAINLRSALYSRCTVTVVEA